MTSKERIPTKHSALSFLRQAGLRVGTVLDVGVQKHTADLIKLFPDRKHLLFEPVRENYPEIKANYATLEHELIEAAVSDRNGEGTLRVRSPNIQSGFLTSSLLTDDQCRPKMPFSEDRPVREVTLDAALRERSARKPYLLKLDVDGDETRILAGAKEVLSATSCVIIEAPIRSVRARLNVLDEHDFVLWDIVDINYYRGNLSHVDLIFLARWEFRTGPLSPWSSYAYDPKALRPFLHKPG